MWCQGLKPELHPCTLSTEEHHFPVTALSVSFWLKWVPCHCSQSIWPLNDVSGNVFCFSLASSYIKCSSVVLTSCQNSRISYREQMALHFIPNFLFTYPSDFTHISFSVICTLLGHDMSTIWRRLYKHNDLYYGENLSTVWYTLSEKLLSVYSWKWHVYDHFLCVATFCWYTLHLWCKEYR